MNFAPYIPMAKARGFTALLISDAFLFGVVFDRNRQHSGTPFLVGHPLYDGCAILHNNAVQTSYKENCITSVYQKNRVKAI